MCGAGPSAPETHRPAAPPTPPRRPAAAPARVARGHAAQTPPPRPPRRFSPAAPCAPTWSPPARRAAAGRRSGCCGGSCLCHPRFPGLWFDSGGADEDSEIRSSDDEREMNYRRLLAGFSRLSRRSCALPLDQAADISRDHAGQIGLEPCHAARCWVKRGAPIRRGGSWENRDRPLLGTHPAVCFAFDGRDKVRGEKVYEYSELESEMPARRP